MAGRTLQDAQRAVTVAPLYSKGHFRLGTALQQLGRHGEARGCLATASILEKRRQAEEQQQTS